MEAPKLVETLAAIQAEADRAMNTLGVANGCGETRVTGISALRKIKLMAQDHLAPADSQFSAPGTTGAD